MKTELAIKSDVLYYWQGVTDPKKLLAGENGQRIAKVIKQVLDGNTNSADLDLKRAKGYRIYGLRLNQADRVLFTTVKIGGKAHILLLDLIENHDYRKSLALKPAALRNFLIKHEGTFQPQLLPQLLEADDFEAIDKLPEDLSFVSESYKNTPLYHQSSGFIEFSERQNEAIDGTDFPLVIRGSAGSGKTSVLQAVFEKELIALKATQEKRGQEKSRVLFVTKSSHLIQKIADFWYASPQAETFENIEIEFKPFQKVAASTAVLKKKTCVGYDNFVSWMQATKDKKEKMPASGQNDTWLNQPQLVYNELKILAACKDKNYLELGLRESRASKNLTQQKRILATFDSYMNHLGKQEQVDPALTLIEGEQYDFIVVDEGQDFAPLEIQSLFNSAKEGRICLCIDTNQTLTNSAPDLNFVYSLPNVTLVNLSTSYRLPKSIAQLATEVLHLKNFLCKGVLHKGDYIDLMSGHPEEGFVEFVRKKTLSDDLIKLARSPEVAIIIPDASLYDEAYKLFKTPLIFTPNEIKGDEFYYIIAYKLFDGKNFKFLNQMIAKWNTEGFFQKNELSENRSKEKEKQFLHETEVNLLNQLFVGFTRAIKGLYVISEGTKNHALLTHLQKQQVVSKENVSVDESDRAWEEAIKKREADGNELIKERLMHHFEDLQQKNSVSTQTQTDSPLEKNNLSHQQQKAEAAVECAEEKKQKKILKEGAPKEVKKSINNPDAGWLNYIANFAALENMKAEDIYQNLSTLYRNKNFSRVFFTLLYKDKSLFEYLFEQDLSREVVLTWLYRLSRDGEIGRLIQAFTDGYGFEYNHREYKKPVRVAIEILMLLFLVEGESRCCNKTPVQFKQQLSNHYFSSTMPKQTELEASDLFACNIIDDVSLFYLISKSLLTLESFLKAYPRFLAKNYTEELAKALCTPMENTQNTVLWRITRKTGGSELLNYMFNRNRTLSANITPDAFYKFCGENDKSVFYHLAMGMPSDHELLKKLWLENAMIRDAFKTEMLFAIHPKTNVSAFYGLTRSLEGLEFLLERLVEDEKLFEEVSSQILYNPHKSDNTSAIYWLTVNAQGQAFLKTLTKCKKGLLKDLTGDILSNVCSADNTSVLYWLVSTTQGIALLNEWLAENPTLLKGIRIEALSGHLSQDITVLHWLSSFYDGSLLLNKIFEQNDNLFLELRPATLFELHPIRKTTFFYWLIALSTNHGILTKLWEKNEQLFEGLTKEALYTLSIKETSAFYWLSSTHNGRILLTKILLKNQWLIQDIIPEVLYTIYPTVNTPAFYWLAANADYYPLLNSLWILKPELACTLTADALCNVYAPDNTSAFYWLAKFLGEPQLLLKQALSVNPALIKKIKAETLSLLKVHDKTSALYWLASNEIGCLILLEWLNKNEKKIGQISSESLYSIIAKDNTSTFSKLLCSQRGMGILEILLSKNGTSRKALTFEILSTVNIITNESPLDLLMADGPGTGKILDQILASESAKHDPRIVDAIYARLEKKLKDSMTITAPAISFFDTKTISQKKDSQEVALVDDTSSGPKKHAC